MGPWDLGSAKGAKHTIETGSAQPIQVPPRRVPFYKRQEMRCQLDKTLEAQTIEPSESSWYSAVVLVAKAEGTQRFCVDYRALNKVTKSDLYPLPGCDDILESLAGAHWFSHLDLLCGYWQIEVAEDDRGKNGLCNPRRSLSIPQVTFFSYKCTGVFHEGYVFERFVLVRLSSVSR